MILTSIGYGAEQPGTGKSAVAATGDSLDIQAYVPGTIAELLGVHAQQSQAGYHQITAPSFSDTTRGLRYEVGAVTGGNISAIPVQQGLQRQERLSITIVGNTSASTFNTGCLSVLYQNLPGRVGFYLSPDQLRARGVRALTVYLEVTGAAGTAWSGREVITAESDLLRTTRPYALLGATTNVTTTAVGVTAPDWSNGRVAIPGLGNSPPMPQNWFTELSAMCMVPLIPVFDSGNKSSIYVDVLTDVSGTKIITLHLVELSGSPEDYNPMNMAF